MIPLRPAPDGPEVELLRCRRCSRSRWRSNGTELSRDEALGALGPQAGAPDPAPPRPTAPVRKRPAVTAPTRAAELRELLTGWQVLGS